MVDLRVSSQQLHHVTGAGGGGRDGGPPSVQEAASSVGADDVLVLRRITSSGWTHLGGVGKGADWAGVVEVDESGDEWLAATVRSPSPVRLHDSASRHVVGPYWAASSALVRVGADHVVVLGATGSTGRLQEATDDELGAAANAACAAVGPVSPARHLADEVEVLAAVTELIEQAPTTLDQVLQHVCRTAARALSCELAALWLPSGRFVVLQHGDSFSCDAEQAAVITRHILDGHDTGPLVVQDSSSRPLPAPLAPSDGVASYLALPLAVAQGRGALVVVHSVDHARGFTALCQQLGARLADSAARLIDAASSRAQLELELTSSRHHATRDPLTGVGNRRGWDEALEQAGRQVGGGAPYTVVTVDLDGLKSVNDTRGHFSGDELIVACAQALRRAVRGTRDVVARLGGDEFGLLLAGAETPPQVITHRLRLSLEGVRTPSGLRLRTSVGAAVCPAFGSLPEAVRRADAAMYVDKRSRQTPRVPR